MLAFPGCKINIGLQLTHRRPDGFHNLLSAFYPIGWTDVLEIIPAQPGGGELVRFVTTGLPIPGGEDPARNLCVRAYHLLRTQHDLPPVEMHLHKLVPIGAGLGGGSADAAATINLLDQQFGLGLSQLGSDCAFFVQNRPQYCIEKGDVFEEINLNLSAYHPLLVYPNLAISTAEAYAGVTPRVPEVPLRILLEAPVSDWRGTVHNDFEDSLFPKYPVLAEVKQHLYDAGAVYASLSGSGSTLYGLFPERPGNIPALEEYMIWGE
jgi:4-diphosphocytidyl-2-C-methyl-D-erythritol kinase